MIIHIGFPKCASTSIQSGFANSNAQFLGCNPKSSIDEFYDKKIGNFFEGTLRIGSDKKFKEQSKPIMDYLHDQDYNNSKQVILSYENICFRLTPWDLPTDIKINRLCKIIPPNPKFVICFRNIKSHILSLYKNYLSFGYTESFNNYIKEVLLLENYGFLDDLNLSTLKQYFFDNLSEFELVFSNIENENSVKNIFKYLKLKISNNNIFLNKSFVDTDISAALDFNKLNSQKSLLGWLECHRIFSYSDNIDEMFFMMSRNRISQANYINQNKDNLSFSFDSFEWPDEILKIQRKNSEFVTSNTDNNINFIN